MFGEYKPITSSFLSTLRLTLLLVFVGYDVLRHTLNTLKILFACFATTFFLWIISFTISVIQFSLRGGVCFVLSNFCMTRLVGFICCETSIVG